MPELFHTLKKILDKKPKKPAAKTTTKATKKTTKGTSYIKGNRLASGLTVEQEAYCYCRASGMSIEESIIASGGSISRITAQRWENPNNPSFNPKIRARIAELSEIAQKNAILKTGLTREWVISKYMQIVDRCMQAEPVMARVNGELVETGQYEFNASGANTALRALGDAVGLFNPQAENKTDEFEHLSDDDLARLARELAAQTGLLEDCSSAEEETGPEQIREIQALPETD